MELLLLVLFCSPLFALSAASLHSYGYEIDQQMDAALSEYSAKVAKAGDFTVDLEGTIGIGGFVLTGPKLRDLRTLRRVGTAWLWPFQEEVTVSANLTLDKMQLDGEKILGPGMSVDKPRLDVRSNLMSISFVASLQTIGSWLDHNGRYIARKGCSAEYTASIIRMSSVVLVTKDGVTSLDHWVQGMLPQISNVLNPLMVAVFEKHFDLCQSLRTNDYKLWNTGGAF